MNAMLNSAYKVVHGHLEVETRPGYCLKLVRQVVEDSAGLNNGEFYGRLVIPHLGDGDTDVKYWWARGAERALRRAGFAAWNAEPGDLIFSYKVSKPYGHVGILLDGGLILENTTVNRGFWHKRLGAVRLTPLEEFDDYTTIISWKKLHEALGVL